MTKPHTSLNDKKIKVTSLYMLLSISLSLSLMGCSHFAALPINETSPQQASIKNAPPASSMIPSPEKQTTSVPRSSLAQRLPVTAIATLNDTAIYLEVANTPQQQTIGLMYRASLGDDQGMLFPFSPPRPVSFWMRNVEINLDMLFIQDGTIVAIEASVPPCQTTRCPQYGPGPAVPIDYVLEIRGGRAEELGIEIGDSILITELTNALPDASEKHKNL